MPAAPEPLRLRSTRSYRHLAPPVSPRHTLAALPAERDACTPLCINSIRELQRVLYKGESESGNARWRQNLCAGRQVAFPQEKRKEEEILCLLTGISPVRIDRVGPRM